MARLTVTVIGDDRDHLVATLSGIATSHGANWEESRISELAGKCAGVIVLSAADAKVAELTSALESVGGQLEVAVQPAPDVPHAPRQRLAIHVLGNDQPGIVHEVSNVLARAGLSISTMRTECLDAPMAGGQLFEANIVGSVSASFDSAPVRRDLERLASEIQVDIDLAEAE